ncbi:hypothetical protein E4656_11865 [Natronospirillum operosum]|uniref:MAE-28990/MAE-18760-like HEPN domain-containing protein n=1 Tax=Natronospirillum operosum TaxID=2759953 RepID=A0A4Z0WEU6_9GAMM|nr:MAE_28990/MAE_18760 family HEPN-like nuclease [Natronospirillum operosum]TGG92818.1 hypothetical protein E4656_11865 [Natronospirillum operosum]
MEIIREEFEERANEVKEYLNAIYKMENEDYSFYRTGSRNSVKIKMGNDLPKVMKATFFLLLYNLIESTIRSSFKELYDCIQNENKVISEFKDEYKLIWIMQSFKGKDPVSSNQSTYRNLISDMVSDILNSQPLSLSIDSLPISGNLDARKTRELLKKHGISEKVHYKANGGSQLLTIKEKRNALAHGHISFAECGREYTHEDLASLRKETVVFLRSVIRNIDKYIKNSGYVA